MPKSRAPGATQDTQRDRKSLRKKPMCIFEEILSDHVAKKIAEERMKYDEALLRADRLLKSTRSLRSQVGRLTDDYAGLEWQLHDLHGLQAEFRRAARERIDYMERDHFLAGLIPYLMAQHQDKDLLVPMALAPRDWGRLRIAPPKHKRRFLSRFLCGGGRHGE